MRALSKSCGLFQSDRRSSGASSPTRGRDDLLQLHTMTHTHDGECVFCQHHTLHTSGCHLTAINWVYYNHLMFTSRRAAEECYKYILRQRAGEYLLHAPQGLCSNEASAGGYRSCVSIVVRVAPQSTQPHTEHLMHTNT